MVKFYYSLLLHGLLPLQFYSSTAYMIYYRASNQASRKDNSILYYQQRASHQASSEQEHVKSDQSQKSVIITAPYYYPESPKEPSLMHNIHVQPCLSKEEAATCLSMAKKHAQATGCWDQSTGRHTNYNTVDFEVEDSEELSNYLNDIGFHNRITQQLSEAYDIDWSYITFLDLFCSNYEAKKQKPIIDDEEKQPTTMDSLVMHRDGSLLSFSIVLSDPSVDFEGGGTTFDCLKDVSLSPQKYVELVDSSSSSSVISKDEDIVVRVCKANGTIQPQKQGYCTLHSGKMLHGADVVTKGNRCVLVGFMDVAPFVMDTGRLGEACKKWGRLDVMKRRYKFQEKKARMPGSWTLRHAKFLPKTNMSHLPTLGIPFPSVAKRADEQYQRRERLIIEDWFLRGALLPPDQRDPTSMLFYEDDDDITVLE